MESGEDISLELETTVPTDLSISPDETSEYVTKEQTRKRLGRQLYEKKQLQHDYQMCKLQLSQKSLMLDNLKAEYIGKVEELEEKLSESKHQTQILQTRLESELKIQQTESKRRQGVVQTELEQIMKRQQQLESTNRRLQEKAVDIKQSLRDLELTEGQYHELHAQQEAELSLKDYVALRMYELVKPWKLENGDLKTRFRQQSEELRRCQTELDKYKDAFTEEQRQHKDMETKFSRQVTTLAEVKQQVKMGDYKVENFDRIQKERDEFDSELTDLKKRLAYLETGNEAVTSERDDLRLQVTSQKQTVQLLQQDKDYFSKQVSELHNKLLYNEEKVVQLNEQLERAKDSREELYDKYVASRDKYRSEYETRLKEELDQIRLRNDSEIDRMKSSTKDMYERENRTLREARDLAYSEKERAQQTEREALGKYEQLMQDFRQLQATTDNHMSELRNEVKLRSFEAERSHIVYEESARTLKECQLENEKLSKKLEVLLKEHFTMQTSLEKRTAEMETLLAEKNVKLESYEKLEQELDNVVLQAAEVEDEDDAERVMFSYGYGANVPTNTKRRLKQSVHLAKRVLTLERTNTQLKRDLDTEKTRNKQLAGEIKNVNSILDASQQPYHYLVESIRLRDAQITKQKEHTARVEDDLRRVEKERNSLAKAKNQLSLDLERLLNQKEEMSVMKEVVMNLSQRRIQPDNIKPTGGRPVERDPFKHLSSRHSPKAKSPRAKAVIHDPRNFADLEFEDNVHKPEPTKFTATDNPNWYKQVQAKAKLAKTKLAT